MSQEWSPEFKMLFWKILGLGLSELALQSSLKKHLGEKLKKVDPHYSSFHKKTMIQNVAETFI